MTWRRTLLLAGLCLTLVVGGGWWWLTRTTSGLEFLVARAEQALGEQMRVESVSGSLADGIRLLDFHFENDSVRVAVVDISAHVTVASWPFAVTVANIRADGIRIDLRAGENEAPGTDIEILLESLRLPLQLDVIDLQATDIQLSSNGAGPLFTIDEAQLEGRWHEQIEIAKLELVAGREHAQANGYLTLAQPQRFELQVKVASALEKWAALEWVDASASLSGGLKSYDFSAEGNVKISGLESLKSSVRGTGSLQALHFDHLQASSGQMAASATGDLGWAPAFHLAAELDVKHLDPHAWLDSWPAVHPVLGTAAIDIDNNALRLHDATLQVAGTTAELVASGRLDFDSQVLSADLEWQDLAWPVGATDAQVASQTGSVKATGKLDEWTVNGELALAAAGVDDGLFRVVGQGNRDAASAVIKEGQVLGGTVAGNVSASWRNARSFAVELDLSGIQPGTVWPQSGWAGELSGHVDAHGQLEPLQLIANLKAVKGEFKDRPLTANGSISFAAEQLNARDFEIRHGSTAITLNGSLDSPAGVRFDAHIEQLDLYQDHAAGDLRASGTLHMRDDWPVLSLVAESRQLKVANTVFENVTVHVDATGKEQNAVLKAGFADQVLDLTLSGAFQNSQKPTTWQGTVRSLEITGPEHRMMHLTQPVAVQVAADKARVDRFCFAGVFGSSVCAEAAWVANQSLDLLAEVEDFPVNHVNQVMATGYVFDQRVTGAVDWHRSADLKVTGGADIRISPGTIRSAERDDFAIATDTGTVQLDIRDGVLLDGELHLPLPGTGSIDGEFTLADLTDVVASDIAGRISIAADNLGLLQVFVPAIDRSTGRLRGDVVLSGTVASPLASGDVRLQDAAINYRPLGLSITELQINSRFDEDRSFEIDGSFRAGAGLGRIETRGNYLDAGQSGLQVELHGTNLTVINVPDVEATADADVTVGFVDGVLSINGKVLIPHAKISPKSLPATRQSASPDVVIVAGELPEANNENESSNLQLAGKLEVGLGDDVVVDLDVARAKVKGTTTFEWKDSLVPVANGRYELTGDVQAYGQVLKITEGLIRFPKVPANNPHLRIRAERDIFGNSLIKRAGILIDGTVKNPTVEAYTEPRTTEERALTLLVTGSDFDLDQGVGAIDFGTYIAPKLFVSYGVGLFDQENIISARYDLSKGFGIKATSAQKESGIDLIYRIDR
ncbi:MAG TPA: translocation/assembly module TamB domain-containing protein [Woeseiaceae bacterium]|nr:translocation/assembly module TamB domain-containing protein [Woeseiaceae bacterium]